MFFLHFAEKSCPPYIRAFDTEELLAYVEKKRHVSCKPWWGLEAEHV